MMRLLAIACLLLAGFATATPARADERILGYDSLLAVQADGSMEVTETITVRAEGTSIRRGIYRDFPTRYRDRFGNRVVVGFEVLGVERDGRPEPWFTERRRNGVRVNTGNDDLLPTPATYTYSIRYRTNRQLGFFEDHDELYWNVTGLGWEFPIDAVQATVTLPEPVPSGKLQLEAYTGSNKGQGLDYRAASPQPGVAVFRTTRPFGAGENLTIVVGFPKGVIAAPTATQKWQWFLRDNRGALVALGGFALLLAFYLWRWFLVGRDPPSGSIFPRYEPPADFSPAEVRRLTRSWGDTLCFTADVVDMAVRGYLLIHQEGKHWRLERVPGASAANLRPAQAVLAANLFKEGDEVELKNSQASRVRAAMTAHDAELTKRLKPRYYLANGASLAAGIVFSLVVGAIALVVARGSGIPALVAMGMLTLLLHFAFGFLLRAPTTEGRRKLDEIEGLRLYLGVAERDELASLRGPGEAPTLDARRYEMLLPYALALQVEEAWTRRFTEAVGAAAAQEATPSWYYGSGTGARMGLASLGQSLGSTLNSQISASATPPGSSSGGGGGGFSGGGGGGGGGGGR